MTGRGAQGMRIERREEAAGILLTLEGRLDAGNCRILEDEFEKALRRGAYRVALDMDGVDFLSSAGIRSLLRYRKVLASLGGDLRIRRSSAFVREILEMVGMDELFATPDHPSATDPEDDGERYVLNPAGGFHAMFPAPGKPFACEGRSWGLGIGSFGGEDGVAGEVMVVAGFAMQLPPGDGGTPDFMAASGEFVPSVRFSSGLVFHGESSMCLRFSEDLPGVPLSALVGRAIGATGARMVAMAIVAETSGLVGASLNLRSTEGGLARAGSAPPDADFFAFPAVREHLAYWPEKRYDRHLAVVVGAAAIGHSGDLAPQFRSLGPGDDLRGHFHAAVFPFRAIPRGRVELRPLLAKIFDALTPVGMLHLLHDRRPISGAGESAFLGGALWAGPLTAPEGGDA